jgi:hypothetical protein
VSGVSSSNRVSASLGAMSAIDRRRAVTRAIRHFATRFALRRRASSRIRARERRGTPSWIRVPRESVATLREGRERAQICERFEDLKI